MQTEICDNCKTPAGEGEKGHKDWVKLAKFYWHEGGDHAEIPPAVKALLASQGQVEVPGHLCPSTYDFCSDQCAALFVINGYEPNLEGLFTAFAEITPEDLIRSTSEGDEQPGG